ncbi:acyl-CoA synthetase (AMP-forming)/AMP-acid ligase II [Actinocorallia herbida]|uniref:Acyl-CoA synthetase (AMP-forming)/AMP-acid ligase II n=1 Tax=Actinocorallia herbida TaxID=58109 RepID=A0A3N1CUJ7_9ACTN|nr:AMP-binding protein [Actinocorallia herbida]ROO84973.1 acyl-CoA synthetase (AMP-forming)/AMP-acid ligase II [Actinocorallia herbida]
MTGTRAHPDTLPGVLEQTAREHPTRPAVRDPRLTYPDLLDAAMTAAAGLIGLGVRPGESVGVWAPNGLPWITASYGVLCAGARLVPLNTRYTAPEAADLIARSGCRVVIAGGEGAGGRPLAELAAEAGARLIVSPEELEGGPADRAETLRRMGALRPETVSHVQYTSGTTGRPKGALLRHGGLVETTRSWVRITGLRAGDVYPVVAPFAHIGGHKTGLLACAVAGAALIPVPSLDPAALARAVAARGVTFLQGPPALFRALLAEPEMPRDAVRVAVTGAAVVPRDLIGALRDRLGIRHVFTAYGLTEAGGVLTITRPDDPVGVVSETSGLPIPGTEVRIDAPDGPGEILVRGPGVMTGYLDDPAATAEAFSKGWLRTGDVGELDAAGRLRIVDRLKDIVIVGGLNVYPAEVEHVLTIAAGVRAAAVVGIPHARLGEVPAAFVVGGGPVEKIVARCAARLAAFKVPRTVWQVDALPLTAAGKVDKAALRRAALDRLDPP